MEISAKMVKDLREMTGAGMMDCKKALVEVKGDMQAAIDFLRKTGIAKAGKRAGNSTNEGTTSVVVEGNTAVAVEVLCETDFVAINDKFKEFVKSFAAKGITYATEGDIAGEFATNEEESIKQAIAIIQENMQVRRMVRWTAENGQFASYLHAGGKIGVLVQLEGEISAEDAKALAMHIAAFAPQYVCSECVPADAVEREREVLASSEDVLAKPENMRANIVNGKINKWFKDICLVDQAWIHDDKSTFAKTFPKAKVVRFVRWVAGEQI